MDFKEIMEYKRSLIQMRRLYTSYVSCSEEIRDKYISKENMEKLANEIAVIDGYIKYAEFANKLNDLYVRRKVTKKEDVKKDLDTEIEYLTSNNEAFFGLAFFNDLAKKDSTTYNELKEKYPIHVTRPETFYKEIGENVVNVEDEQEEIDNVTEEPITNNNVDDESNDNQQVITNITSDDIPTPNNNIRTSSDALKVGQIIQDRRLDDPTYEQVFNAKGMTDEEIEQARREIGEYIPPKYPSKSNKQEDKKEENKEENKGNKEDKKLPTVITKQENKKPETITLQSILYELIENIDLSKGSRKSLVNSEIRVVRDFTSRFKKNNNWIYNVFFITSTPITAIFGSFKSVAGKLYKLTHPQKAVDLETVRDRLNNLSKEKLEILRKEYPLNKAHSYSGMDAISPLIYERLAEYIEVEYNQPLREEIEKLLKTIIDKYTKYQELVEKYDAADTDEERNKIQTEINKVCAGSAKIVKEIDEKRIQLAQNYNSSTDTTSLSVSYGAVDNNSNRRGRIFAKRYSTEQAEATHKLLKDLANRLKEAKDANDDERALLSFCDLEIEEIDNTKVENSFFGKRSVGLCNWTATPHISDIGPDPLMGYIMRTIATIGLAKGIYAEIYNQLAVASKLKQAGVEIHDHNSQLVQNNQNNYATMQNVNAIGKKLSDRGADYKSGLDHMSREGVVDTHAVGEYFAHGSANGTYNNPYHTIDNQLHIDTHAAFDSLNKTMNDTNAALITGKISTADAIQQLGNELTTIERAKQSLYAQFDSLLQKSTLPNRFDYTAYQGYLPKISQGGALTKVVDGMVESVKAGETLQKVSYDFVAPLAADIPTHIQSFAIPIIAQLAFLGYFEDVTKKYLKLYSYEENKDEELSNAFKKVQLKRDRNLLRAFKKQQEIEAKEEPVKSR